MNEKPNVSGKVEARRVRPVFIIGTLLLAAAVVVAMMVFPRSAKQHATSPETVSPGQAASVTQPTPTIAPVGEKPSAPLPGTAGSAPIASKANSNAPAAELIKTLNDENQSLKVRGKAAKALAGLGTSEAMSALKSALVTGSDSLRASIAAALGESQDPQSASMLRGLLTDKAESVALAAVQALAQQGSPEAVAALSQLLYNTATPLNVRCEAALGLGEINQPGVVESLSHAAATIGDESIVTQILNALGSRPIEETRGFFESYLHSPTASAELKITAIEALGQAQGDPSALLLDVVRNPDAELRAAAAWALSSTDVQGNLGAQLTAILQNEADPDVRRRLYQALGNQEGFDVASIQALIQKESDPAARIAGMDLLAQNLRSNPSSALSSYFDQNEVPDLKNLALTSETSQERMAAVTALKRAATAGSLAALQELALLSTDKRVTDSANATFAKGPGRR